MPEPVEIKLTLNKDEVRRDLARMKEKVRQGQTGTPATTKPDTGRVGEVEKEIGREIERRHDDRIAKGAADTVAQNVATTSVVRGGVGSAFFPSGGAGLSAGGVAAAGATVVTAAYIAAKMAEGLALFTPIIVGVVNDYLKQEFPWLSEMVGDDAEEFAAKVAGKVTSILAKAEAYAGAVGDVIALEAARARLDQTVDARQIGDDFTRIRQQKENDAKVRRKSENEAVERAVRNVAKQLMAGGR